MDELKNGSYLALKGFAIILVGSAIVLSIALAVLVPVGFFL